MAVVGFFIFGAPGETARDFEATQNFIRTTRPHVCGGVCLSIHPQALLWQELIGKGEPENLNDSVPVPMDTILGHHTEITIRQRREGFKQAFLRSWLNWRRLIDGFDLFIYNPTLRRVMNNIIKILIFSLLRGLQRKKKIKSSGCAKGIDILQG